MTDSPAAGVLSRLKEGWKKNGVRLIVLLGAVGILLILLSEWLPAREKPSAEETAMTTAEYTRYLEEKLVDIVENIAGAGHCRVMVTLENGVEYIYATEDKNDQNYRQDGSAVDKRENTAQKVIVVDDRGLLVTEILPTVQGVVVVCEGGHDEEVKKQVSAAVATVLQISERRICVLQQS